MLAGPDFVNVPSQKAHMLPCIIESIAKLRKGAHAQTWSLRRNDNND